MAKGGISGFNEWLPAEKLLEDRLIRTIRGVYESHGFTPIETPAVELLSTLQKKGQLDKEIYVVQRLHEEDGVPAELALHYDLTVPFARYVASHFNDLDFPFRRYQLQKVWRGERTQRGRSREFYQFDIDTIAVDELPLACDAEILSVLSKAYGALALGPVEIRINHRMILQGFFESVGVIGDLRVAALRIIDKIDKIGAEQVGKDLAALGISVDAAEKMVKFSHCRGPLSELKSLLAEFQVPSPLFSKGIEELAAISSLVTHVPEVSLVYHGGIARAFDYYTGIIMEAYLTRESGYPSVGGGGRYEDLASEFIKKKLPGVGVSIGLTRLMELILEKKLLPLERSVPTEVLVSVYSEAQRARCNEIADEIRREGLSTEVYFKSPKLGKQIEHANKRGIQFVIFVSEDGSKIEAKNLKTGEQQIVQDFSVWAKEIR